VSAHGTKILHTTSNDTGRVKYTNDTKRQKLTHVVSDDNDTISIGMKWSNLTLSCAYDCLFTILRNIYIHNHVSVDGKYKKIQQIYQHAHQWFGKLKDMCMKYT